MGGLPVHLACGDRPAWLSGRKAGTFGSFAPNCLGFPWNFTALKALSKALGECGCNISELVSFPIESPPAE